MFSYHNQAKAIAAILCGYCRARSRKTPYKCMIQTNNRLDFAVGMLKRIGWERGIFESKRDFVTSALLSAEDSFVDFASSIELFCLSRQRLYWYGTGAKKNHSSADVVETSRILGDPLGSPEPEGDASVQVEITAVWDEVAPFLEK